MSNGKELDVKVKTVAHGEVLSPGDDGYEPKEKGKTAAQVMEEKRQQEREAFIRQGVFNNQEYAQQNYYHQPGFGQMGDGYKQGACPNGMVGHRPNSYGCMQHAPYGLWPCKNCGNY